MTVGRNEVTPADHSALVTDSISFPVMAVSEKSTPMYPLICRSTRPGAIKYSGIWVERRGYPILFIVPSAATVTDTGLPSE